MLILTLLLYNFVIWHSLIAPLILSLQKNQGLRNYQAQSGKHKSSKILFSLESQNLSLATNTVRVSCGANSLDLVLRKCLPNTQVWITILCLSFFQKKKYISWIKCWVQFTTQIITQMLFLKNKKSLYFILYRSVLCVLPILLQNI